MPVTCCHADAQTSAVPILKVNIRPSSVIEEWLLKYSKSHVRWWWKVFSLNALRASAASARVTMARQSFLQHLLWRTVVMSRSLDFTLEGNKFMSCSYLSLIRIRTIIQLFCFFFFEMYFTKLNILTPPQKKTKTKTASLQKADAYKKKIIKQNRWILNYSPKFMLPPLLDKIRSTHACWFFVLFWFKI